MRLNLLSSTLCVPDHGTVRGEYRVQPSLRRTVPQALYRDHHQDNNPLLRILILACSACHPSEYCHCGHHHFLSEGPIPAEAGAEEAGGICSQGRHFILSPVSHSVCTVSASSNWLAPVDNPHGSLVRYLCNHDTMSFLDDACTFLHGYPLERVFSRGQGSEWGRLWSRGLQEGVVWDLQALPSWIAIHSNKSLNFFGFPVTNLKDCSPLILALGRIRHFTLL